MKSLIKLAAFVAVVLTGAHSVAAVYECLGSGVRNDLFYMDVVATAALFLFVPAFYREGMGHEPEAPHTDDDGSVPSPRRSHHSRTAWFRPRQRSCNDEFDARARAHPQRHTASAMCLRGWCANNKT